MGKANIQSPLCLEEAEGRMLRDMKWSHWIQPTPYQAARLDGPRRMSPNCADHIHRYDWTKLLACEVQGFKMSVWSDSVLTAEATKAESVSDNTCL